MPDQHSAADEHAILEEITAPLASLPDDSLPDVADVEFPRVLRGYDPLAVDAYVKKTTQLVAELQTTRSPEAAVRRALERVGEQISGILQRAHETAEQITTQSRREAEDRLEQAREEAQQITASSEQRIKDLDADADRIWVERLRIVEDARELAAQLLALADDAVARFPPAEDTGSVPPVDETGSVPPVDETGSVPPVDETVAPDTPTLESPAPPPAPAAADEPPATEAVPEVELFDVEAEEDPDKTVLLPPVAPPPSAAAPPPAPAPPPAVAPPPAAAPPPRPAPPPASAPDEPQPGE
jgi:DivIVA domain-containing protein